jgi:hypothetical protein
MKNPILRTLISAILFSLVSCIVISTIGLILRWNSSAQFSDGFFWVGFLLVIIWLVTFQGYSHPTMEWPLVRLTSAGTANLWEVDSFHGNRIMTIFGIAGLLMFGMSILVMMLF